MWCRYIRCKCGTSRNRWRRNNEKVIKEIQSIIDTPLQIDSNNPKVIEKALRVYNGKAIVNSVNGEEKILDSVLPLIKNMELLLLD